MSNKVIFFIIAVLVIILIIINVFVYDGDTSTAPVPVSTDSTTTSYMISFSNESEYVISPGLLVIHDSTTSLDYLQVSAPPAYEPLAEVGEPAELMQFLAGNPAVQQVILTNVLEPGQSGSFTVTDVPDGALVSYMGMIVQTNDGVVLLSSVPLQSPEISRSGAYIWTDILDMGTEENTPIGSGFEGGQPDPARGEENIDNGTPTPNGVVTLHPQFYADDAVSTAIMRFSFSELGY